MTFLEEEKEMEKEKELEEEEEQERGFLRWGSPAQEGVRSPQPF